MDSIDHIHPFNMRDNPITSLREEWCPICKFTKKEIISMAVSASKTKTIQLRDLFAGFALVGSMANSSLTDEWQEHNFRENAKATANAAFEIADIMLKARDNENSKKGETCENQKT